MQCEEYVTHACCSNLLRCIQFCLLTLCTTFSDYETPVLLLKDRQGSCSVDICHEFWTLMENFQVVLYMQAS
jgi:hypothetical protein